MKKIVKNLGIPVIILIGVIPLLGLFHNGLPLTHDGQDHVARIANFYQSLAEGNIIPRWAGNLNWGYGHPVLMFLYPLPSYLASLFHFLGFSLVDSLKIVFGAAFILSGITMYLWIQSFLGKNAGVVAGVLYMIAPYRFVDMYVRGAIGEHVAFVFMPLIFYFMLRLSKSFSKWNVIGGSLSVAGLLVSHNAISIMFLPFIILYAIYLSLNFKNNVLFVLHTVYFIILGFGISAFFWIPAFFEGKYTLRDIVTAGEYANRFVPFSKFIYNTWNFGGSGEFSLSVGFIQWIGVIVSVLIVFILKKRKDHLWILGGMGLILFAFTIFMMTPPSKFIWDNISLLQKFQFPWRFMSIIVFMAAGLSGLVIFSIPNKFKKAALIVVVLIVLLTNINHWMPKGYLQKDESFYKGIYHGTTDTGESAPRWSVRFMLEEPDRPMEVITGSAEINQVERSSTRHVYSVISDERTRLRENTLYFPGWEVYVDGKRVEDVEFQDPGHRGLMTFYVEEGEHEVAVRLGDTKLRMFANAVSAASILMVGYVMFTRHRKKTTDVEI